MTVLPILVAAALALVLATGLRPGPVTARRRTRARLAAPRPDAAARPSSPAPVPVAIAAGGLATAWVVAGPTGGSGPGRRRGRRPADGPASGAGPRTAHRRDQQMPGALDRLAASLRSGASLTQALREVGDALDPPLGPEVATLARAAERGRPLREVLDEWSATHDDPGTRLAATALVLAAVVGSTPARAIDGVAATLRERLDLAAERRALAVQARTERARAVRRARRVRRRCWWSATRPRPGFLLGTPAGWACLALGLTLDARGRLVDDPPQPERRLVSPAVLPSLASPALASGVSCPPACPAWAAACLARRRWPPPVPAAAPSSSPPSWARPWAVVVAAVATGAIRRRTHRRPTDPGGHRSFPARRSIGARETPLATAGRDPAGRGQPGSLGCARRSGPTARSTALTHRGAGTDRPAAVDRSGDAPDVGPRRRA